MTENGFIFPMLKFFLPVSIPGLERTCVGKKGEVRVHVCLLKSVFPAPR